MLLPSAQWLSAVYRPSGAELYLMSLIPSPACLPATSPPFLSRWFWGILLGGTLRFQEPCGPHAPAPPGQGPLVPSVHCSLCSAVGEQVPASPGPPGSPAALSSQLTPQWPRPPSCSAGLGKHFSEVEQVPGAARYTARHGSRVARGSTRHGQCPYYSPPRYTLSGRGRPPGVWQGVSWGLRSP